MVTRAPEINLTAGQVHKHRFDIRMREALTYLNLHTNNCIDLHDLMSYTRIEVRGESSRFGMSVEKG